MQEYAVAGRNAATDATADDSVATLWNPSSTRHLWVVEMFIFNTTAGSANVTICRQSTRGTPASTVTPDIDNDLEHDLAPPTAAVLDLGNYSAEGTKLAPDLEDYFTAATIGAGIRWNWRARPIRVKPGQGLTILNFTTTSVPVCSVGAKWQE